MIATTTQVVILHQAPKVIFLTTIWILRIPFMIIQSMYSLVTSPWCWSHQPDNPSTLKASPNPRCSGDVVALSDDIPETLPCSILVQTVPGVVHWIGEHGHLTIMWLFTRWWASAFPCSCEKWPLWCIVYRGGEYVPKSFEKNEYSNAFNSIMYPTFVKWVWIHSSQLFLHSCRFTLVWLPTCCQWCCFPKCVVTMVAKASILKMNDIKTFMLLSVCHTYIYIYIHTTRYISMKLHALKKKTSWTPKFQVSTPTSRTKSHKNCGMSARTCQARSTLQA